MTAFLIYVLKSALVLALLVSLFMIFMSRETFHRVNRYIMLSIVFLALLLPAVNLGIESPFNGLGDAIKEYFAAEEPLLAADTCSMPVDMAALYEQPVLTEAPLDVPSVPVEEEPFNWLLLAAVVYFAGVALLVVRQVVMYVQVARMIARGRVVDASMYGCKGINLRVHRGKEKPFSWFRWVVVSENDLGEGAREILIHETAHAHAGHSWDIVLADAVIIMQWFNPLAWIMKNSLKDIHEFEADEAVINSGVNAKQYQLLIIKKAVGARLYSIANSFNHSLTKKRITMMCKEKSKKWRCAKALYIVPVAAIAALAFTTVEPVNAAESETLPKGSEIIANEANVVSENYVNALSLADDERVYQVCEKAPEFPGGQEAMMKYLASNIKYPAEARDAGKEGRAIVKFVVKKDGLLTDIKIARSAGDASLDGEALRVVKGMPKWNPGTQGGKPVNVQFMLPIVFKLNTGGAPVVELKGGGMAVNDPTNAAIVVDGVLLEGELTDIDSKDIESVTVVKYDALTAEDIRKYKAEGKDGVIFISLKTQGDITEVKFTEQEIRTGDYGDIMPKCEQMPIFPGGDHELMKWLNMNTRYPKVARDINAQGKIYVDFVVKADGTIADVKAINSEYSSNNAKVMDAMNLEAHFLRSQAVLDMQENELRDVEECIAKWEKESKVLEEDGVAEVIMERRREELEKARVYVEESKKRIAYARSEVENAHQRLADAKSELGEVVVTAYKNSNGESITGEELLELEKAALVALGDEAERVIRAMPKWKPGMQDGKAVNVRFTLPINFRLQ